MDAIATMNACQWGAVLGASLTAACWDIRTTRIPNWLTLSVAAGGLFYSGLSEGASGVGEGILAWACLALPFIVLFLLGQGGAGDAKMMGALGTWLGVREGLVVLCCVGVAGGVLAILRIALHRKRTILFRNLIASLYVWLAALAGGRRGWHLLQTDVEVQAGEQATQVTLPYGIAIFLGACFAGWAVHIWDIG